MAWLSAETREGHRNLLLKNTDAVGWLFSQNQAHLVVVNVLGASPARCSISS